MSIAEKLVTIAENEQKVYEAGEKAEWDKFWDTYQDYGKRTRYGYAFSGIGWAKNGLLPPKYHMTLSHGTASNYCIFTDFNNGADSKYDMSEICAMMDCSNAIRLTSMYADAKVENITVDMGNCSNAQNMFSCANGGGGIDKVFLKVTEKLTSATNMFLYCTHLETLRFTEDSVIAVSLSFAQSSLLSNESVDSIVNALKDLTGATARTLTVHADVYNKMVANGKDVLVTAKNWTLVSA